MTAPGVTAPGVTAPGVTVWPQPVLGGGAWLRFAWGVWIPTNDQGTGHSNRFVSQLTGVLPGTTLSQQGNAADISYPVDVAGQFQFTQYGVNASSALAILVTGSPYASPVPLIPTGAVLPTYNQVIVSRMIMRWDGIFQGTNGGIYGFLFGGTNSGVGYSYANVLNTNTFIGIMRDATGVYWGYRPTGGPLVQTLLATVNPNVFTQYEHRLYSATATIAARYELRINDTLIATVSFATAGTPRYGLAQGLVPGFLFGGGGLPAERAALRFTAWEIGVGPDTAALFAP